MACVKETVRGNSAGSFWQLGASVAMVLSGITLSATAQGWYFSEHSAIGTAAYQTACAQVREQLDLEDSSFDVQVRFDLACGIGPPCPGVGCRPRESVVPLMSTIYGQACALAGDHLDSPAAFLNRLAGRRIDDFEYFAELALRNVTHFHPESPRQWMQHYRTAIRYALQSRDESGSALVLSFERGFYTLAFAAHFLQDAFAAGHMAFNRPGSSAAAALAFHDYWNKAGRAVRNYEGDVWVTLGDGCLNGCGPSSDESRKRVVDANVAAIVSWLLAFIVGGTDPIYAEKSDELEKSVLRSFPIYWQKPTDRGIVSLASRSQAPLPAADKAALKPGGAKATELVPLEAVFRPATTFLTVDFWTLASGMALNGGTFSVSGLAGMSVDVIAFPARFYLGVGGGREWRTNQGVFTYDLGLLFPLKFSNDGLLTHHLAIGGSGNLGVGVATGTAQLSYRMHIEFGKHYLHVQLGPGWFAGNGTNGFAWYASVGYGCVVGAFGGGLYDESRH